ncbi:hypothetical protein M4I21_05250 [Cellulophaga sp. 20_2_10]|uniref:hypothetical protein n=1 Tax=Cellulophaga sp. 20_2_10 TaxID=2942476 RepID=UPI00201A71EB|nr:hypothetical protein [Cellulophaga sp. 20_2_10]MCL5245205.1 hypothetical protein [Cellulophaga sp. 20_2_10]
MLRKKIKIQSYSGLFFTALYGVLLRVLRENFDISNENFILIFIVPAIISLIPVYYATTGVYTSRLKLFFYPFFSTLLFLIICYVSSWEDFLLFLLLGLPFYIITGVLGILVGGVVKERAESKK